MKVLLDSHTVIWWVDQDHLLSPAAHSAITDPANDPDVDQYGISRLW